MADYQTSDNQFNYHSKDITTVIDILNLVFRLHYERRQILKFL